tara:strand:+ start:39786 stop:40055 length:270 start_codon:yes stop_codon:yes gene_type:complete
MLDLPEGFEIYQCQRIIGAMYIAFITQQQTELDPQFVVGDGAGSEFIISPAFMAQHNPMQGGYIVMYEGGLVSYVPKTSFEHLYTKIED